MNDRSPSVHRLWSILFGSVLGVGLIAARRASMASKLPFGCFLAVGAALSATVGSQLLGWYLGLFH